jgi:endothelin-converting enzyme/putative endopeptidase
VFPNYKPITFLSLLFICCIFYSCSESPESSSTRYGEWGVDTHLISDSISPSNNFYEYVNEGWRRNTKMPAGHSIYSAPWAAKNQVDGQLQELIKKTLESKHAEGASKRVQDFYLSFINTEEIEKRGTSIIKKELDEILAISSHEDVAKQMAHPRASSIFHLLIQPPVTMEGGYILTLAQYRVTGLGLPGQAYYKSEEAPFPNYRDSYKAYIASLLTAVNISNPEARAERILRLETQYANIMWDFERLRDAGAAFNLVERNSLNEYAPGFPWEEYLNERGVGQIDSLNIGVGALKESAQLFRDISVDDWVSFLAFHWINDHTDFLPESFEKASFEFYEQGLRGVEEQEARKDRAMTFIQRYVNDDVGEIYVKEYFPPEYEEGVNEIVEYLRKAFREKLVQTDWMDENTREEALSKLDNVIVELGAPKVGVDWSGLETQPDDLYGNYSRLVDYRWTAQKNRLGKPISRLGDWNMGAFDIGMGYHQQYNKIFITAGALLPPFYDPTADPAVNFGAVGQTLAHEFGHALDDQGSKFDRNGMLRDWWSDSSRQAYENRTSGLIRQYGEYETLPGVLLQSEQMLGEIVGDLIGTSVAIRGYELYVEDKYSDSAPVLDGFTGIQRFFLGTTQQTRTIATEEALRDMALHESHPPAEFRINGVLRNLDEWYDAFDVNENSPYYLPKEERIRLW